MSEYAALALTHSPDSFVRFHSHTHITKKSERNLCVFIRFLSEHRKRAKKTHDQRKCIKYSFMQSFGINGINGKRIYARWLIHSRPLRVPLSLVFFSPSRSVYRSLFLSFFLCRSFCLSSPADSFALATPLHTLCNGIYTVNGRLGVASENYVRLSFCCAHRCPF